jgi:hypothetical protein
VSEHLEKPATLPEHLSGIWDETAPKVRRAIGPLGLEALCGQIFRMRDAQERITRDGAIVADAKGNPCPHPALAIEKQAQGEVRAWIVKFGAR